MKLHDIICIKTTGEKVFLLAETERKTWKVRRPVIAENGSIGHEVEEFFEAELESVEDFTKRLVSEMILKANSQRKLLSVERAIVEEVENEAAIADDQADGIKSVN